MTMVVITLIQNMFSDGMEILRTHWKRSFQKMVQKNMMLADGIMMIEEKGIPAIWNPLLFLLRWTFILTSEIF